MISNDEKARRIALGRHAGGFLRALAGDRRGIAAHVCRTIGDALTKSAGPEPTPPERVIVVNNAYISRGGDA